MYVAIVPNRGSAPAILLRESFRDGNKVKNRTLKNLSDWPAERIELLRAVLRGDELVPAGEGLEIVRALPHGHVLAALGTARRIKLDRLLPRALERRSKLALAADRGSGPLNPQVSRGTTHVSVADAEGNVAAIRICMNRLSSGGKRKRARATSGCGWSA